MKTKQRSGLTKVLLACAAVILIFTVLRISIISAFVGLLFLQESDSFLVKLLPYSVVRRYLLYDHITFNGVDYYLLDTEESIPDSIDNGQFIMDDVYVVLVDKSGVPYDRNQRESAWLYANDTEQKYIYYYSAQYTKDKSLASSHYGFGDE